MGANALEVIARLIEFSFVTDLTDQPRSLVKDIISEQKFIIEQLEHYITGERG